MIEFKNIEIRYGAFAAVSDLNLTIQEGEFFTLLGPSGCGKTTTLRTLVGFIKPSQGNILVNGKDITHESVEKRKIGMVFQSYALFPTMNVFENIAFGLKVKKMQKEQIRKMVLDVAKKVELTDEQLNRNVSELSGGQQQRVALARAVVLKPSILCLDEPLSNLDAKLRIGMRAELKRLQKQLGITTIYVTHDQEEALTLSNRIAVFNNGKIEQVGTPDEIYNRSASQFVCEFIGDINRLDKSLVKEIESQVSKGLDVEKQGFIRTERIHPKKENGTALLKGKIQDLEFNGIFTKCTIQVGENTLKFVAKNDGKLEYKLDEIVEVYVDPNDIMQF